MGLACQTAGHGGLMSDGQAVQIQLVGRGQTLEKFFDTHCLCASLFFDDPIIQRNCSEVHHYTC